MKNKNKFKNISKFLLSGLFLVSILLVSGCGLEPAYLQDDDDIGQYLKTDIPADQKIKQDISTIRSALLVYASEKGTFPPKLSDLVPKYLPAMLENPITGENYEYKSDLIKGDYELRYQFSNGQEIIANKDTTDLEMRQEYLLD